MMSSPANGDDKGTDKDGNDTVSGAARRPHRRRRVRLPLRQRQRRHAQLRDAVFDYVNGGGGSDKAQVDPGTIDSQDSLELLIALRNC
jgi:hypothetical protein